ncbi:MAG: SufB/SufD family protein, partial [Tangfeifania sp.]
MSVLVEKADLSLKYTGHFNDVKDLLYEGSSDVLNSRRGKAFRDFVLQGIPSRKNENYKYTNLQPKFAPDYKFFHQHEKTEIDLNTAFRCDVPQLDTLVTYILNGWYYEKNQTSGQLPEGVILDSLEKISHEKPELLAKYGDLANTAEDPLVALNTAFAKDGYFLYVPKNVAVEKPIQIINFLKANNDAYATQRNFIYIEEGADVKMILCDHTLNLNSYLNNSVTEVYVGANASFEYYTLQNQHNKTTSLNSVFIHQERDSKATTLTSSLHGGLIRNNLKFVLDGENAESNLFGMAFIDRKQHVDNFTQVIHAKPHCLSNQVYKNVLDDESTGAFSGRIHVVRDAQKTNAFQR